MTYPTLQASLDPTAPYGHRNYWRSACLPALDDAAIEWIAARCLELPTPHSMIHVHQLGGAIARGSLSNAAGPLRNYEFIVNTVATWERARQDDEVVAWARRCGDGFTGAATRRAYVNFSGNDAAREESFAPDVCSRIDEFKRRHDPQSLFL